MEPKELGMYLAKIREESGFKSQRKLAEKSGISSATLSRIESGIQKPLPETLHTLSKYLNVTYEELMKKAGYVEDYGHLRNRLVHQGIDKFSETRDLEQFLIDSATFYSNILTELLNNNKELYQSFADSLHSRGISISKNDGEFQIDEDFEKLPPQAKILYVLNIMEFVQKISSDIKTRKDLKMVTGYDKQTDLVTLYLSKNHQNKYAQQTSRVSRLTPEDKFKELPIVGRISCGNGILAYQEIEGYETTPREWLNGGEYFYLRAKGDSMTGARIQDGDLLLIRRQNEVENGEVAAVYVNGEAVLKRVYKQNGSVVLQSENPKYPPIICTKETHPDFQIIGKLKRLVVSF